MILDGAGMCFSGDNVYEDVWDGGLYLCRYVHPGYDNGHC